MPPLFFEWNIREGELLKDDDAAENERITLSHIGGEGIGFWVGEISMTLAPLLRESRRRR